MNIDVLQSLTIDTIINLLFGGGMLILLLKGVFRLGEFNNRFMNLEKRVVIMEKSMKLFSKQIRNDISILNYRFGIDEYSRSRSPRKLKKEYRYLIEDSGLDAEVEGNKENLIKWLKRRRPSTGLEAQDEIMELIASGVVEKYMDLQTYEEFAYNDGMTSTEADTVLALYLFEVLIPEVV